MTDIKSKIEQVLDERYSQILSLIVNKYHNELNEYISTRAKYNSKKFGSEEDWKNFKEQLISEKKWDKESDMFFYGIIDIISKSFLLLDENEFLYKNNSLKIDDSWLIDFDNEIKSSTTGEKSYEDIKGPLKTFKYSIILEIFDGSKTKSVFEKYNYKSHPYVYQREAHIYLNSKLFLKGFLRLFEGIEIIRHYPNYYWNSEYGMYGSSWLLLLLVKYISKEEQIKHKTEYTDLLRLTFMYLTRTTLISTNPVLLSDIYANRARFVLKYFGSNFFGLSFFEGVTINPELQLISDLHMAYHVWPNEYTYNDYAVEARTWYQNGSPCVNDTGGYVQIDDRPFMQIVNDHVENAKKLSYVFFKNYYKKGRFDNNDFFEECKVLLLNETHNKYKDNQIERWKDIEDNIYTNKTNNYE